MGSHVSTVTSMAIWPRNVGTRRKRRKLGNVLNATKNGI